MFTLAGVGIFLAARALLCSKPDGETVLLSGQPDIFTSPSPAAQREARASIACVGCGRKARDCCCVRFIDYDRTYPNEPESRYEGSPGINQTASGRVECKTEYFFGFQTPKNRFFSYPSFQLYSDNRTLFRSWYSSHIHYMLMQYKMQ